MKFRRETKSFTQLYYALIGGSLVNNHVHVSQFITFLHCEKSLMTHIDMQFLLQFYETELMIYHKCALQPTFSSTKQLR